jgi:hypothetical protein
MMGARMTTSQDDGTATSETVTRFFEKPVLNSPSAYPSRHWELDASLYRVRRLPIGRT